jgi:hypothetical protein
MTLVNKISVSYSHVLYSYLVYLDFTVLQESFSYQVCSYSVILSWIPVTMHTNIIVSKTSTSILRKKIRHLI